MKKITLCAALLAYLLVHPRSASAASCESLSGFLFPATTINLAQIVAAGMFQAPRHAAKVGQSVRLFMVPGMAHCGGGEGPNNFDPLDVIH
jgi:hypothetical protein